MKKYSNSDLIDLFINKQDLIKNDITYNFNKTMKIIKLNNLYHIYSYNEILGELDLNCGIKKYILYGKTAKYNWYFSQTTSTHFSKLYNNVVNNSLDDEQILLLCKDNIGDNYYITIR